MLSTKLKAFYISVLLLLIGCDFRIPQEWETPSWEFDLTIPLVNEEYSMASIATESNDIQISSPDSTDFIIQLNESIINEGDVVTDESFFIIPGNEIDLNLDQILIENPNPMPEFPEFSEVITIQDFIGDLNGISCLPTNILEDDLDTSIVISINSFCDEIQSVECLDAINWVKIGEGSNVLSINNNLPFKITEFELNINSNNEIIISDYLNDIDGETVSESDLFHKNFGCEIDGNIYFKIDSELEGSSNSEECNLYEIGCELYSQENGIDTLWQDDECLIPIILDNQVCNELGFNWQDNQCIEILTDIDNEILCNSIPDTNWDEEQCYYIIEMNEEVCTNNEINGIWQDNQCYISCTDNETCCLEIGGTWDNDECSSLPSFEGLSISGDESLSISNEIILENFDSMNANIDCLIDTSYSTILPVDPNISLIEGHISSLEHLDTNRIALDLTNNFFADILFNISSNNLFDSNDIPLNNNQFISEGESFEDIILSDYTIKNNDGSPVDLLSIDFSILMEQDSVIFNFDDSYGISGDGIDTKTIKLDELIVNLNEFSTSDIDMGNIPSGFDGFDIPFLTFNLHVYNQISADMKLYLDLFGIRDDDTLRIHVEPDIKFLDSLDPYFDTDSLIISFYQDTMLVKHIGNGPIIHDDPIISVMDSRITELFSYDIIDISGYAVMDGDATLVPNKSLWADIEIIIEPLTIIIKDGDQFSFTPDAFTPLAIMDRDIATKIDSGLISATINMNINNNIPFGGDLLMYISNSPDYFPLCIDSLQSGDIDNQIVDSLCLDNIKNYLNCDNLDVIYDDSQEFVKHLDCESNGNIEYYYENLLGIDFLAPNLDDWGNVIDSVLNNQEFIIEDEIFYFTKDESQYLIPRFIFDSDLDTLTFQPSNSLHINSYIIFRLLTSGLLE